MASTNMFKTAALLAALTALMVLVGGAIGGGGGMVMAFFFAVVTNFFAFWFSGKVALMMSGAKEVSEEEVPWLHQLVADVAHRAGLPKPKVAMIQSAGANAFATGRDPEHAVVAVTTGIVDILERDELAGVLSHELGHVKNRDILIMGVAATIAGAITMLAYMAQWALFFGGLGGRSDDDQDNGAAGMVGGLLMVILAPTAATIIQLAISRAREFSADAAGAEINGDPEPLARALAKLEEYAHRQPMQVNPATAHLYIVNPVGGFNLAALFSTHPSTADRIARLRAMRSW